jgi:serine protease Do
MKTKHFLLIIAACFMSAFAAVGIYQKFIQQPAIVIGEQTPSARLVKFDDYFQGSRYIDFTFAAEKSTPAVVHVKTTAMPQQKRNVNPHFHFDPFGDFFRHWGDRGWQQPQPRTSSGSGVIIAPSGFIVTNNHVIAGADQIEITLHNNETYIAELIGADPSTDIALLKIDKNDLPYLNFTNSDLVRVGEWVLAVGNPFNLSSTVTAGIVSAKARNINILEDASSIESFIQTDAAVNPGNSGGALVNMQGELIGINTAIASPTGAYAGYAFAVPANIVRKVVEDIQEYGLVQRGFLGVNIKNINAELAKSKNLPDFKGVYIDVVNKGSAAYEAGIREGDVIRQINNAEVNTAPKLQEIVAQYRPGDKIQVTYMRNGNLNNTTVVLKNKNQNTELITKESLTSTDILGVEFIELSDKEKKELGLKYGVKVSKIKEGKLSSQTNIKEGFIITSIDRTPIQKVDDITNVLKNKKGGVMIEGIYPNYPGTYYYAFGM